MSQNKEEKKNRAAEQAQQANVAEAEASAAEKAADSPDPAEDAKAEDAAAQDPIQKELEQTKDLLLRTAAEYENYKRRSLKEKEDSYAFAVINTVGELLPCIDNFERAAQAACEDEDYKKGCMLILQQFTDALKKLNIVEMDCLGKPFNPDEHNAVMHVEDETLGENVVAEVLQKGYKLGDRVVRHAMVKVAN